MKRLMLAALMLFLMGSVHANDDDASCVDARGTVEMFDNTDQIIALQDLIKANDTCERYGVTWIVEAIGMKIAGMLVHDLKDERASLYLVKIEDINEQLGRSRTDYILWHPANRADVLAEDPTDGYDLPIYAEEDRQPNFKLDTRKWVNKMLVPTLEE